MPIGRLVGFGVVGTTILLGTEIFCGATSNLLGLPTGAGATMIEGNEIGTAPIGDFRTGTRPTGSKGGRKSVGGEMKDDGGGIVLMVGRFVLRGNLVGRFVSGLHHCSQHPQLSVGLPSPVIFKQ